MSLTPISQKAHDISFAVFRVATLVKNADLRVKLENAAVDLVSDLSAVSDIENSMKTENCKLKIDPIERLESLVSLAESVGEMKPVNASVLKRELGNLQTAIDFHINTFKGHPNGNEDLDISGMFPSSTLTSGNKPLKKEDKVSPQSIQGGENLVENFNSNEPTVRQMAILRNIRETEFCRLRNIVEAMPNISERTIRNDIQGLIEKGLVRRVGGGGPSSYFETMELALRDRSSSIAV